ncbi:FAD-dependent oxidoreductase [Cerasicoccus arenae]|uniref:Golvesin/Xly CBD-like domain-containing protein n=1 Tax=Cerasicoccus arenae TaxID=424488 RepID=A0A8J3DF46_9BACT|nr:FAD-dependent oxidoreductase [Cerasicoccus arenae]MBK1857159.1 FAD-dependent oxidoreductase [Cerasicoccus arenae]GHB92695.1 hypothetical protein GCM10007047_04900 [Cerasicoccus arenae]
MISRKLTLSILSLAISGSAYGAADTPNPGLQYYYPAPDAPIVDVEADIIVYGGTSGGVTAAVQAARQGNSVALVVFGRHVGGLTSGGLTATDGVDANVQGGITREYFDKTGNTGFKPSKAEAAFEELLADPVPGADWDTPIPTYYEQRLAEVEKDGPRIISLRMENGSVFRGRMFIDCTYEGDLMAMADVPYTFGREAKTQYGESLAGREASVSLPGVDPYVVPGDSASGLIANILPNETEDTHGQADEHIQAYNFRMYTVQNTDPTKLQPFWQPPTYNADDFEILYRYHRNGGSTSMQVGNDINNHEMFNRGVSTDHIGGNRWTEDGLNYTPWCEASYAIRELIYQSHVGWQLGMLWYIQNDPRYAALATDNSLPAATQTNIANLISKSQQLGLPLGEYPETDGWPHELYVREARRMVSDFVVTQQYYNRELPVVDSVGMANYRADAHHNRRFVSTTGTVRVEGDTGGNITTPWQIPYRALVPPEKTASNLLVPWCLSASHVAFCSIRMEPCLMALSQSATIAAGLAIAKKQSVQQVDYEELRPRLLAAGQILGDRPTSENPLIIDNLDSDYVEIDGDWLSSQSTPGYSGTDYLHNDNAAKEKSVIFRPDVPKSDSYQVFLRWTSHSNRATNVPIEVTDANGVDQITVNQQVNGGSWYAIGEWYFDAGSTGTIKVSTTGANGYVIVDAVKLASTASTTPPIISLVAANPIAREQNGKPARIQIVRDNISNQAAIDVNLSIAGDAVADVDYRAFPSIVTIPTGKSSAEIWIYPIVDDVPQGTRQLTISIEPVIGYELGTSNSLDIAIEDKPADQWRYQHFSPTGEENSSLSAPNADPDGDSWNNRLERYFGTDPNNGMRQPNQEPRIVWNIEGTQSSIGLLWHSPGAARDMAFQVYYSNDLTFDSWQPLLTPIETISWSPDNGDRSMIQMMNLPIARVVFFKFVVDSTGDI